MQEDEKRVIRTVLIPTCSWPTQPTKLSKRLDGSGRPRALARDNLVLSCLSTPKTRKELLAETGLTNTQMGQSLRILKKEQSINCIIRAAAKGGRYAIYSLAMLKEK